MKKLVLVTAIALAAVTSSIQPAAAEDPFGDLFGPSMSEKELKKAIDEASAHPLGSEENPVRVNMPYGQRAYLAKLRCSDSKAPSFKRSGSVGIGPFGNIVDLYKVNCVDAEPAARDIYMDMYHPKHNETAAVPGYTIAAN